ncbi:MAG: AraC family transcriptional regulator ligand-binding domain-containing protein [Hyphomonas sp.]
MTTVSSGFLGNYIDSCVELGAPDGRLLALVPGGRGALGHPDRRFPAELVIRILERAAELTGSDAIGIEVGRRFRPSTLLDVSFALGAAGTIREALAVNSRYQALTQEIVRTRLDVSNGEARITGTPALADPGAMRRVMEAVFAGNAAIGSLLTRGGRPAISLMQFRHADPGPQCRAAYRNVFGDRVVFGAGEDAMVFPREIAERSLPGGSPAIMAILTGKLDRRLAALRDGASFAEQVYNCVQGQLGRGRPSLERTAALTGLTDRTLRRRLAAAGTSFGQILKDARREAAEIYIRDPSMSLTQVAFALSYGEQTAFVRAFRDWFGLTPGAYRRRVAGV